MPGEPVLMLEAVEDGGVKSWLEFGLDVLRVG